MTIRTCIDAVRRGDPDKYLAVMMAPQSYRRTLFPIYAFNLEIGRIVYGGGEPALAEMKLQWWEDQLSTRNASEIFSGHEILDAIIAIMDSKDIPLELFLNILRARRFDLYAERHDSFDHQIDYLKKIFSSLFEISLRANLNTINQTSLNCVRDFGFSYGVANLFLSLNKLEELGKKPMYIESIPAERVESSLDLDKHYLKTIKDLASFATKALSSGRLSLKRCDDRVLPVLYCASMVSKVLRIVERKPDIVKTDNFQISALSKITNLLIARVRKYL